MCFLKLFGIFVYIYIYGEREKVTYSYCHLLGIFAIAGTGRWPGSFRKAVSSNKNIRKATRKALRWHEALSLLAKDFTKGLANNFPKGFTV